MIEHVLYNLGFTFFFFFVCGWVACWLYIRNQKQSKFPSIPSIKEVPPPPSKGNIKKQL